MCYTCTLYSEYTVHYTVCSYRLLSGFSLVGNLRRRNIKDCVVLTIKDCELHIIY